MNDTNRCKTIGEVKKALGDHRTFEVDKSISHLMRYSFKRDDVWRLIAEVSSHIYRVGYMHGHNDGVELGSSNLFSE